MDDTPHRYFDTPAFRNALATGLRNAFLQFRQEHPNEKMYAFILVSDGEGFGLCLEINTEEALTRRAQRQATVRGVPFDLQWASLQWSGGDWEYQNYAHDLLSEPDRILNEYAWVIT